MKRRATRAWYWRALVSLIVAASFLGYGTVAADGPPVAWEKTLGFSAEGRSVQQTLDGGYIVAGRTASDDIYLLKTDSAGNTQWEKAFNLGANDYGYSVDQTSDGGYVIAGTAEYSVILVKTDSNGDMQWQRTVANTEALGGGGFSCQQTSDGGYIVTGHTTSGPGFWAVLLAKTDSIGNVQWERALGGYCIDEAESVQQTSDGGYIVAGRTCSFGAGNYDVYLIKTNAAGSTQWEKTFGGTSYDQGYSVQQTADGGYIIVGSSYSYGAGEEEIFLVKTDSQGSLHWRKTLGPGVGRSVGKTTGAGYVITGLSRTIRTDSTGNVLWEKAIGGYSVQETSDNGYVIAATNLTKLGSIKGRLDGAVRDQATGAPIEGAEVDVPGQPTVYTNELGEFSFPSLPIGQATVSVRKDGYWPATEEVTINGTSTTFVSIVMVIASTGSLSGVVLDRVTGQPIPRVIVNVPEQAVVLTDEVGEFNFPALRLGSDRKSVV